MANSKYDKQNIRIRLAISAQKKLKRGSTMKWMIILLLGFSIIALLAQQSLAAEKYTIKVNDKNNQPIADAFVTIWDGQDKLDSGYTDNSGSWDTWLDSSTSYRITASKNDQSGEKVITPGNTYAITINMN
jgi:hypothetical protein